MERKKLTAKKKESYKQEENQNQVGKKKVTVVNISYGSHDPDRTYHVRKIIRMTGPVFLAMGILLSVAFSSIGLLGVSIFGLLLYITHYPEVEVICPRCRYANVIRRRVGKTVTIKCRCRKKIVVYFRRRRKGWTSRVMNI